MKSWNIHLSLLIISGLFLFACNKDSELGKILITQAPLSSSSGDLISGEGWRYVNGAQILLIDPKNPSSPELLSVGFHSACSPDISWDASFMLFAGKKEATDPWQIWRMDLKTRTISKISQVAENCTDPLSMPNGRIIFSSRANAEIGDHSLFSCSADGSESNRITFHPHATFAPSVLHDGRIVATTSQLDARAADPLVMVFRPDGTKAELFYKALKPARIQSKFRESDDGRIFFVECDTNNIGGIVSVKYNRPLFTGENCSSGLKGSFKSVFPVEKGKLLVSYQEPQAKNFALYEYNADDQKLGAKIYYSEDHDIIDVISIKEIVRPKKLPSEVDMGVKTGLLLCQDINFTGLGLKNEMMAFSDHIEIAGMDSSMGLVKVEKDGSFYLKIVADTPFRMITLDGNGKEISKSAWIWLRPNERRGCIGCHAHPELSPDNRVPISVKKEPISIPVHISSIKEKDVELE